MSVAIERITYNNLDVFDCRDEAIRKMSAALRNGLDLTFSSTTSIMRTNAVTQAEVKQKNLGECFFTATMLAILYQNPYLIETLVEKNSVEDQTIILNCFLPEMHVYSRTQFLLDATDIKPKSFFSDSFHNHTRIIAVIQKLFAVLRLYKDTIGKDTPSEESLRAYLNGGQSSEVCKILFGKESEIYYFVESEQSNLIQKLQRIMIGQDTQTLHTSRPILTLKQINLLLQETSEFIENLCAYFNGKDRTFNPKAPYFNADIPNEFAHAWQDELLDFATSESTARKLKQQFAPFSDCAAVMKLTLDPQGLPKMLCSLLQMLQQLNSDPLLSDPTAKPGISANTKYSNYHYAIFKIIQENIARGDIITASTRETLPAENKELNHVTGYGLVQNHVYAVINVEKRRDQEGRERLFIWLKNPWQYYGATYIPNTQGGFDRIAYSEKAPAASYAAWIKHLDQTFGPAVFDSKSPVFQPDVDIHGVTVLELQDFLNFYDTLQVCAIGKEKLYCYYQVTKTFTYALSFLAETSEHSRWIKNVNSKIEHFILNTDITQLDALLDFIINSYLFQVRAAHPTQQNGVEFALAYFVHGLKYDRSLANLKKHLDLLNCALNQKATLSAETILKNVEKIASELELNNLSKIIANDSCENDKLLNCYFIIACLGDEYKPALDSLFLHLQRYFSCERLHLFTLNLDERTGKSNDFKIREAETHYYQSLQEKLEPVIVIIKALREKNPNLVKRVLSQAMSPEQIINSLYEGCEDQFPAEKEALRIALQSIKKTKNMASKPLLDLGLKISPELPPLILRPQTTPPLEIVLALTSLASIMAGALLIATGVLLPLGFMLATVGILLAIVGEIKQTKDCKGLAHLSIFSSLNAYNEIASQHTLAPIA